MVLKKESNKITIFKYCGGIYQCFTLLLLMTGEVICFKFLNRVSKTTTSYWQPLIGNYIGREVFLVKTNKSFGTSYGI